MVAAQRHLSLQVLEVVSLLTDLMVRLQDLEVEVSLMVEAEDRRLSGAVGLDQGQVGLEEEEVPTEELEVVVVVIPAVVALEVPQIGAPVAEEVRIP